MFTEKQTKIYRKNDKILLLDLCIFFFFLRIFYTYCLFIEGSKKYRNIVLAGFYIYQFTREHVFIFYIFQDKAIKSECPYHIFFWEMTFIFLLPWKFIHFCYRYLTVHKKNFSIIMLYIRYVYLRVFISLLFLLVYTFAGMFV